MEMKEEEKEKEMIIGVYCINFSWGDLNRCLLIIVRTQSTDQINYSTQVYLDKPMQLLVLFTRS